MGAIGDFWNFDKMLSVKEIEKRICKYSNLEVELCLIHSRGESELYKTVVHSTNYPFVGKIKYILPDFVVIMRYELKARTSVGIYFHQEDHI